MSDNFINLPGRLYLNENDSTLGYLEDKISEGVFASFEVQDLSAYQGTFHYLDLDVLTSAPPWKEGRFYYNSSDKTASLYVDNSDVSLQLGKEIWEVGVNKTGVVIPDGSVVYLFGAQGQRPKMWLAKADSEFSSNAVIGVVTHEIGINEEGKITKFGDVNNLDLSEFYEGDVLYVSPLSAGKLTNVKPTAPNHAVRVGIVVSNHHIHGILSVDIQNGWEISELHDVSITNILNNNILTYNSSLSAWNNTATPTFNNLTLNSGTLTADSPFSLNQTWNNAGVVFTGFKQNITDAASNSSSLLMDLQVGGVSKILIKKDGGITTAASSNLDGGVRIGGGTLAFGYASDVVLLRTAANILSLRNSTNPQEFQIYGTYTSATSYERMIIKGITSSNFQIGTEKGSGGGTARGLDLVTDGTVRWTIGTDGSFVASTPGAYVQISTSGTFRFGGSGSRIKCPSNGQMTLYNAAENDFNLLQFGGNASNRPAIRRNGTSLDIVLADSSAYTNLYVKNLVQLPASTITPANNGELVFEATSDSSLTVKYKGSDGVVRTGIISLT